MDMAELASAAVPPALGLVRAPGGLSVGQRARIETLAAEGAVAWARQYRHAHQDLECVLLGIGGDPGDPAWCHPDAVVDVYDEVLVCAPKGARERFFADGPISINTFDIDPAGEEAMNRWYAEEHIPNLLQVPGYRTAVRFRSSQGAAQRYLTLYELVSPDYIRSIGSDPAHQSSEAAAELANFLRDWDRHTIDLRWDICLPVEQPLAG
jgi:hypothetical protein